MSFTPAEVAFLAKGTFDHPELTLSARTQLADVQALRALYGPNARAVAELIKARRSGKFPHTWLADADSAQQATPPTVATWRAEFLKSLGARSVVDVTCSIGTEGHAAIAAGLDYAGADLDFSRLLMARHNVANVPFMLADALAPAVRPRPGSVIVADPARRAGGKRITDPAKLQPPLPDLLDTWRGAEMAVKCAPGLDFSEWEGQVAITSVAGAVKEACLFTPGLAAGRRAVMLDSQGATDCVDSAMPDDVEAGAPGRYIIDPDGAVVRAGLVRHYAKREGLWQIDEHLAYLTGPRIPAGRSGFEILEQVPMKKLRSALTAYGCGSVEILVRGVDVDPDVLRKRLKLKGKRPLSVVIARVGKGAVAFICGPRVSSEAV
ncbi:SAM-dependent methyltransferase [Corynebacterium phocae]|uniref:SAM-dependent methyltransferase n=1 Tax=Corynebacterium phocae TaxID=161895 RepID=A0A1L7D3M1_9CORY|nr:SAM-dependent methyltransferase [Corynebacterium phocae]APT92749.1 SAM-dependent methyltransferase [Corynebacterium phocae]KAA8723060.1 SAM-dependent methyltransferase [Corynebacterium phocae]